LKLLVREIGRGRDVEKRTLEMTEVLQEGGRRWWRQESGLQIIWGKRSWGCTIQEGHYCCESEKNSFIIILANVNWLTHFFTILAFTVQYMHIRISDNKSYT